MLLKTVRLSLLTANISVLMVMMLLLFEDFLKVLVVYIEGGV